jgi:putative transposase
MHEYKRRQEAVRRYQAKEKIANIAKALGKGRKWVYLWISRYEANREEPEWYKDHSKAPKYKPNKISTEQENQVIAIRASLENQQYAQTGAISIQYEFERKGLAIPPIWTINRAISRHGLTKQPLAARPTKAYPELFIHTHQMDLVGPRYIKGDGSFYSMNLIDITTHSCYVKAIRHKSSDQILGAIVEFWQTHGLPDALQMDNELAFRGSNRYSRSFGSVVRFALSQGVAPVFIPFKEPWRNGMIEKFNDTYDKRFFRTNTFNDMKAVSEEEKKFIAFHNSHHRYGSQGQKTPDEMRALVLPPLYYKGNIHLQKRIPLETGCIYFIRFIRSDAKLHLPNESFQLDITLKYSYVVAEINIDNHCLVIRQNWEIRQIFPFQMPVDW